MTATTRQSTTIFNLEAYGFYYPGFGTVRVTVATHADGTTQWQFPDHRPDVPFAQIIARAKQCIQAHAYAQTHDLTAIHEENARCLGYAAPEKERAR